ncbi:unnamed protein product [Urochloa decumbens]|uniref:Uncharacterized protein n=1 Tax=Urochloa decumbens TaxID=240449 RepID=A0ABC9DDD9_9POAL
MIPGGGAAVPVVVVPPPPAAAAAPAAGAAAWNRRSARVALATALFVLGCAAAALACFAMALPPADARVLGSCAPTDDEAAYLRAASEHLLVAASGQVLGATVALLVPACPVAVFGCVLSSFTSYRAIDVLWILVSCHGHVHGVLAFHYWLFFVLMLVVPLVGMVVSIV